MARYKPGDYVVVNFGPDGHRTVKIVGVREVIKYTYEDDMGEAEPNIRPWRDGCYENEIVGPSTREQFIAELKSDNMYTGEEGRNG